MRRKEKEIKDFNEIEEILKRAHVCRLGLCNNNVPYIVPMNFGYKDNTLYFHSAKEGKKINMIKENPTICFEIDIDNELVKGENACNWSMKFKSVIGIGEAQIIDDNKLKKDALDIIMQQYDDSKIFEYNDKAVEAVAIIKVKINEISGKKSA